MTIEQGCGSASLKCGSASLKCVSGSRSCSLSKVIRIYEHWSTDPPGLHIKSPRLHFEYPGHPQLHFEPTKLLNFYFNADPDPASKKTANPDPQPCHCVYIMRCPKLFIRIPQILFSTTVLDQRYKLPHSKAKCSAPESRASQTAATTTRPVSHSTSFVIVQLWKQRHTSLARGSILFGHQVFIHKVRVSPQILKAALEVQDK